MGILDLMLGSSSEGDGATMSTSYVLAKETHDEVSPVAVRRVELEALREAIVAFEAAPSLSDHREELQEVFDGFGDEAAVDVDDLVERAETPRLAVEPLLETWLEQVPEGTDVGVVYLPPGATADVEAFVALCKRRSEHEHDEFDLPERFEAVVTLLKRLENAVEGRYRAVVHSDLVPTRE